MAENYLQIRKLVFRGQNKESVLSFSEGGQLDLRCFRYRQVFYCGIS